MSLVHLFLIGVKLIINPLFAAAFSVPIRGGDHLLVQGLNAQVQIVGGVNSDALKVSGIEGSDALGDYKITREDNRIIIRMNEYDKKDLTTALTKSNSVAKKIEIAGPALPTEIHLHSGGIVAQKWGKDLKVSLSQGRFSSSGGSGALSVYIQKGEISIEDHQGKVHTDSYTGNMTLKKINGDVDASLFSGPLSLEKIQGFCAINSRQGPVKVLQGSGSLLFDSGRGAFSIQGFSGRIDGQNQEATVSIQMLMDSEVSLKSKAGRIQIQTPTGSGASVNLHAGEGEIFVPADLQVNKLNSEKNVKGHLRGDSQRGSIFVRSQEGVIILK